MELENVNEDFDDWTRFEALEKERLNLKQGIMQK